MDSSDSDDNSNRSILEALRNSFSDEDTQNDSSDSEILIPIDILEDESQLSTSSSYDSNGDDNPHVRSYELEASNVSDDNVTFINDSAINESNRTNQNNSMFSEQSEPEPLGEQNNLNAMLVEPVDEQISGDQNNSTNSRDGSDEYASSEEDLFDLEDLLVGLEDDALDDQDNCHRELIDMIQNEASNETINANIEVNVLEMWYAILMYAEEHHLPTIAISNLYRMINTFFDRNIIAQSRYKIDQLFNPDGGKHFYGVCSECKNYLGLFNEDKRPIRCHLCNTIANLRDPCYSDYFITFDVEHDIRRIVELNSDYYLTVMNRLHGINDLEDFCSGQKYKSYVQLLPDNQRESYATLIFNSDGAPVFKSSKFSIWPMQAVLNEVPEYVRSKKTIICGVWFGHDKPNMLHFLRPFVNKMNDIGNDGILCQLNGVMRRIFIHAICCCVDSAARPCMQGIIQYNGYYGCNWCLHPGQRILHNRGGAIKYTLLEEIPPRRTSQETLQHMERAVDSPIPIFGVKTPTPLINLDHFDIVDGFVPDPMHCIDLGVAKQFMKYWFNTTNEPYSTPKRYQELIDEQIKAFKVPTQVMQLSRPISDFNCWKAKELQNWILYYSVTVLAQIPEFKEYLEHWCLLVESYHLLLQDVVTPAYLQRADLLLKIFVAHTELLYGPHAMTFNVHQLLHIPQSVADWGPLWSHTGYTFEAGIHRILQTAHAAKGVLSQVSRNLSFLASTHKLGEHIRLQEYSPITPFITFLEKKNTVQTRRFGNNRYFGVSRRVMQIVLDNLGLPAQQSEGYDKMVRNMNIFKSCRKLCRRSDNSFVRLNNGVYARIQQFVINRVDNAQYVAYKQVIVAIDNAISEELTAIKRVIRIDDNVETALVDEIDKLCVLLNFENENFIVSLPNMYWR